ncbi:hypothetical protein AFK68_06375 [Hydrocoleum sp. CS-953]|nr:hypothetical protein AFK68_06375 [Hydrocoleum sp. CS-953]
MIIVKHYTLSIDIVYNKLFRLSFNTQVVNLSMMESSPFSQNIFFCRTLRVLKPKHLAISGQQSAF